jgi:hypothetical protein
MSSRNMCLLPRATLHSDSEHPGRYDFRTFHVVAHLYYPGSLGVIFIGLSIWRLISIIRYPKCHVLGLFMLWLISIIRYARRHVRWTPHVVAHLYYQVC